MQLAIETEGLAKSFRRVTAVEDLSMHVPAGSVYAFLGINGAGKTTTLRMLLNLLAPSAGHASVLGVRSTDLRAKHFQRIAFVSESQRLPARFRVDEYLRYWKQFYPRWDDTLERELSDLFDLPRDRRLGHLSRGMAMKVQLLSSLAFRPELVVLDEPFTGLDALVRDDLIQALRRHAGPGGWTILLSSHDLAEIESLADHVGILHDGSLAVEGRISDLLGEGEGEEGRAPLRCLKELFLSIVRKETLC
jgi:ABC-2 type transport system ATP-binding protein